MAIFEKEKESKTYVVLLDKSDQVVAFITPTKNVSTDTLVASMKAKGLNVEVRESQPEKLTIEL